jgi:hypothetical protein
MARLADTLAAIDAANSADPDHSEGKPVALLYGERMSEELSRLYPDASETLQIAARGQHIERWTSPRNAYPEGREGYLKWRADLALFHAGRVGEIMAKAGYASADIERVGAMLRKIGIKRDAEVQALEDVACFTFLRWYFHPFAADKTSEALERIVTKTARKMSAGARALVLAEFDLPPNLASAFGS